MTVVYIPKPAGNDQLTTPSTASYKTWPCQRFSNHEYLEYMYLADREKKKHVLLKSGRIGVLECFPRDREPVSSCLVQFLCGAEIDGSRQKFRGDTIR